MVLFLVALIITIVGLINYTPKCYTRRTISCGNVLTAGKTGCRKAYFMLKLSVNSFFGKIVEAEWVSSIQLSRTREVEVQSSLICDISLY